MLRCSKGNCVVEAAQFCLALLMQNGVCICPQLFTGKYCEISYIEKSSSISNPSKVISPSNSTSNTRKNRTRTIILPSTSTRNRLLSALVVTSNIQITSSYFLSNIDKDIVFSTETINSSRSTQIKRIHLTSSTAAVTIELISSTIWVPNTQPNEPIVTSTDTMIVTISVIIGISLITTMSVFWLLWKHKTPYRRKSKPSSPIPIYLNDRQPDGISRSSTASGSRSISPLINFLYEKDRSNIDVISILEQPPYLEEINPVENKRYTLKEVDRICMEAIRGKNTVTPMQNARRVSSVSVQKTLSDGGCKSQQSSCYSSSGYGSSCSSPSLHPSHSSDSFTQLPYTLLENRFRHFQTQITSNSRINSEKNNYVTCKIPKNSLDNQMLQDEHEDGDELALHRQTNNHVHFEGLPNFIMYREDTNLQSN